MDSSTSDSAPRRRLLITAYHYDRMYSMESRLSWQRAEQAAQEYDVTVLCARAPMDWDGCETKVSASSRGVRLELLPLNWLERRLMRTPGLYYVGYRMWHRRALRRAQTLHREQRFDLVHHVSFCGYREPSDMWTLDAPFVWGPVGGTQPLPSVFLGELSTVDAVRERIRGVVNALQLRFDGRVRRAAQSAQCVLAANQAVGADIARALRVQPIVQLETGVHAVPEAKPRQPESDQPLRILWAGRLQAWKGLPLLFKGLASLPQGTRYQVRVLGQGPCETQWRRLAETLGITAHIEWAGWPEYDGQLSHYQWADVFAFTSLRDTSGTGLLEALAAGAVIVGLDHQGAADVMTGNCSIPVVADSPNTAIEGFRWAISRLANDRQLLASLSAHAIDRAREFAWDRQWSVMREIYTQAQRRSVAATDGAATPEAAIAEPRVRELQLVETFS
jgi:glycosyltransferase involved in cell wall biosynthesis